MAVKPPKGKTVAVLYLALARAIGIDEELIASAGTEFYPSDRARTAVTQRLVEEVDWLGEVPLVIIHPGGKNPLRSNALKRWPPERFALLGNHLVRKYKARVVLVGSQEDRPLTKKIRGMMAAKVTDLCGIDEHGRNGGPV